jgi:hypothetical protein
MADRHGLDKTTFRPPPEVKQAARDALARHGEADDWTMNEFLVACLRMLAEKPAAMLTHLAAHRPPKKRGRPPKARDT